MIKRTLYLGYYFKQMKWDLLRKFLNYTSNITGKSKTTLLVASIRDVYQYNISILEYFQFRFFEKSKAEKLKWAGTGTMYEFQKIANPLSERGILDDKRLFYVNYKEFFRHQLYSYEELNTNINLIEKLLIENTRLVLKEATGKCGAGVKVISTNDFTKESLLKYMKSSGYDMLETYVQQHELINELAPNAVNTVRIFTQVNENGNYEILGCRMRISVEGMVDNLAAGNIAAPIDEKTGIIFGKGIYSDITKQPEENHPITAKKIVGFQVPYWDEVLIMVKKAALKYPQNRSIGWDVVVTNEGPGLIEGNHDWCKLVWQLPVNQGLKDRLYV